MCADQDPGLESVFTVAMVVAVIVCLCEDRRSQRTPRFTAQRACSNREHGRAGLVGPPRGPAANLQASQEFPGLSESSSAMGRRSA